MQHGGLGTREIGAAQADIQRGTLGVDAAVELTFENTELHFAGGDVALCEGEQAFGLGEAHSGLHRGGGERETRGMPVFLGGL